MAKEEVTTIIRPDIFPKCRNCPIVLNILLDWLTFSPSQPHISCATTSITIRCEVVGRTVGMSHSTVQQIQFIEGRPIILVEGGSFLLEIVPCPHMV